MSFPVDLFSEFPCPSPALSYRKRHPFMGRKQSACDGKWNLICALYNLHKIRLCQKCLIDGLTGHIPARTMENTVLRVQQERYVFIKPEKPGVNRKYIQKLYLMFMGTNIFENFGVMQKPVKYGILGL